MDVAELGIRVDANGAITVLDKFGNKVDSVEKKTSMFEKTVKRLGAVLGAGFVAHKFLHETTMAQEAMAELEIAVRLAGNSAGKTLHELDELSMKIQRMTKFSDEAAKSALSMLLTFNKIDGKSFERAAFLTADLATKMKTDMVSAAQLVGKALQDPEHGVAMLNRQFRLFDDRQLASLKLMSDTGQSAEAQAVIFAALESKVKGLAEAQRNTLGGALAYVKNSFGDLFELSQGGTSLMVKGLNAMGAALEVVRPHMGRLIALVGAGLSAWVAYRSVLISVTVYHAVLTAAQTIQAFVSLALTIRRAADAMALLQMFGGGVVKTVAVIAAATIGWIAYKKILEQVNKESEEFAKNMPGGGGSGAPPPAGVSNHTLDLNAAMSEKLAAARFEFEVAKKTLETYGQQAEVIEKMRNEEEVWNEIRSANLQKWKGEITEAERVSLVENAGRVRNIKNSAVEMQSLATKLKATWETLVNNVQSGFADLFHGFFTDGIKSFQSFIDNVKDMFFRMVSEVMAQQLMRKLLTVLSGGGGDKSLGAQQVSAAVTMMNAANIQAAAAATMAKASGTQVVGTGTAVGGLSKLGVGAGVAGAGLGLGYGFGSSIGGTGGVLAGVGAGAAMGAAVGSVVPVLGTLVGAVVGGLSGLVGGLLGAKKAAKESAEAMRQWAEAESQFQTKLAGLRAEIHGTSTSLSRSLAQTTDEFRALREEAIKLYAGRANEGARAAALNELNRLEAERVQQLQEEAAIQSVLTDRELGLRLARATRYNEEEAAFANVTQAAGMYASALEEYNAAIAALADHDEFVQTWGAAAAAVNLATAAEAARAHLIETIPALTQLAIQHENELRTARQNGMNATQLARLAEVQRAEMTQAILAQLDAAISKVKTRMESLNATITGLQDFKNQLLLSDNVTPVQKLAEARRQYEEVRAKALAGDQAAASRLPQAAQTFLEAAKVVHASGAEFQAIFQSVLTDINNTMTVFEDLKSVEEQMLEELQKIRNNTLPLITPLRDPDGGIITLNSTTQTLVTVTQSGLTALVQRVEALLEQVGELTSTTRTGFEGIAVNQGLM